MKHNSHPVDWRAWIPSPSWWFLEAMRQWNYWGRRKVLVLDGSITFWARAYGLEIWLCFSKRGVCLSDTDSCASFFCSTISIDGRGHVHIWVMPWVWDRWWRYHLAFALDNWLLFRGTFVAFGCLSNFGVLVRQRLYSTAACKNCFSSFKQVPRSYIFTYNE